MRKVVEIEGIFLEEICIMDEIDLVLRFRSSEKLEVREFIRVIDDRKFYKRVYCLNREFDEKIILILKREF